MITRCRVCDACQIACATIETDSGFFLCNECEPVAVIAFQEFELPPQPAVTLGSPLVSPGSAGFMAGRAAPAHGRTRPALRETILASPRSIPETDAA
jgi:hypothetical protein